MATRKATKFSNEQITLGLEKFRHGTTEYSVVNELDAGIYVRLYTSKGSFGKGRDRHEEFTFVAKVLHADDKLPLRLMVLTNAANLCSAISGTTVGLDPVEPLLYTDKQLHLHLLQAFYPDPRTKMIDQFTVIVDDILDRAVKATGSENLNKSGFDYHFNKSDR